MSNTELRSPSTSADAFLMRSIIAMALVALVAVSSASAQRLSVGGGFLYKAGLNAGLIRDGRKTELNANRTVDISAVGLLRLNPTTNIGIMLEIGTAEYSFRMRPENVDVAVNANTGVYSVSKFAITPSLYLAGFTVGASIGVDDAYTVTNVDGSTVDDQRLLNDFGQKSLITEPLTFELRMGGQIGLWRHDNGVLNLNVNLGYMMPGLFENGGDNNARPLSFGIGLNYLFTVMR